MSGYGGPVAHQFQNLKISGIGGIDEETGVAGDPHLKMPTMTSNGTTTTIVCGYPTATDAEEIWTEQAGGGIFAYQSATMESTWAAIVAASTSVTISPGVKPFYMIDVILEANFPPVQPAHCSTATTACSYTDKDDPLIRPLTTGEMEYLIYQSLSTGQLSAGNISIQEQGLEQNHPDSDGTESSYGTIEIPCAMNALVGTAIGYQSGGTPMVTSADKVAYLASIANAVAYGAQYIELKPDVLQLFVDNLNSVPFGSPPAAYGTTKAQNITLLSSTIGNALVTMAANQAHSASGTLCPKPIGLPPYPGVWTYPGQTF